jgi:hypothetical protein
VIGLLDRLVDSGKSVIVIEHHKAVMTPATTAAGSSSRHTLTGEHLGAYVGT